MTDQLEPPRLTDKQRAAFLNTLRDDNTIGTVAALRQAGLTGTRGELRALIDDDLAEQAREARGYGADTIRREIARRAIEGVEEPVFGSLGEGAGSGIVGHKRVYSDRLLTLMAKAHLPEYRDSTTLTVAGDHDHPVEVRVEHTAESVGAVLSGLAAIGLIQPGPALTGHPESQPVLPARTD